MDLQPDSAPDAGPLPDIVQIPGGDAERTSIRDAARTLANFRYKQRETVDQPNPPLAVEQPPQSSPAASSDETLAEPQPGDDAAAAEPVEQAPAEPPIAPPASWSKAEQERFASLPRETQSFLAAREAQREQEVRRGQDETAAERKAIEAERAKVAQARTHYEQALPALVQTLAQQQASDFADVKDVADVERLAREDWPRYVQWDAQQKRIASLVRQMDAAKARQAQDRQAELAQYVRREHDRFVEKAPEFAEEAQRVKLQNAAVDMLKGVGFAEAELAALWRGDRELSVHDHRVQLLIRDGIRYRDAQQKAREATARPVPPVVRPGVAQGKGAAKDAAIMSLTRRLDQSGNLKDAARLLAERRKAR